MDTNVRDVVVVGAGPNGLLMAAELALAGVRPIVLERDLEPTIEPKARGLIGRVVQALDYRGLYESFSQRSGSPVPALSYMFGAMHIDLSAIDDHGLFILLIPQRKMEALLEQRGAQLGVDIRRGHEVTALRQHAEHVTLQVHGPDGDYELVTRFVVGADGAHSTIRQQCGIDFPGITDRGFIGRLGALTPPPTAVVPGTGELDVPGLGKLQPRTLTRTERGVFGFDMNEQNNLFVAVYEWDRSSVDIRTDNQSEELGDALNRVLGTDIPFSALPDGTSMPLRRLTTSNSRQAERYRDHRVFLVGDAAHVYMPVGGPGLNLGMQDVFNLGWKLAAHLHGWAPDGLLDSYHTERYPVGARVVMHSRAQTALLSPGSYITALRHVFEELLMRDPHNAAYIGDLLSGADTQYDMHGIGVDHPLTGRWIPDLSLLTNNGTTRIAELMRSGDPILLDLAHRTDLMSTAAGWTDRLKVLTAATTNPVADAVLIRPDGYVAWAADPDTPDPSTGLRHALHTWFGERNT